MSAVCDYNLTRSTLPRNDPLICPGNLVVETLGLLEVVENLEEVESLVLIACQWDIPFN